MKLKVYRLMGQWYVGTEKKKMQYGPFADSGQAQFKLNELTKKQKKEK
jgi:hypothetical protein